MTTNDRNQRLRPYFSPALPYKRLFENRPSWPPGWKPPQIVDLPTFEIVHRWADDRVKAYIEFPRRNYNVIPVHPSIIQTLRADADFALYANNATSRIRFARIVEDHVKQHWGIQRGPLFFVTFAVDVDAFAITGQRFPDLRVRAYHRRNGQAARFNVHVVQQRVRQALRKFAFFGTVEVGLFKRGKLELLKQHDWVSWHAHVFVWGEPRKAIEDAVTNLRNQHRSFLEWLGPVHIKELNSLDVEFQALYSCKAPQKAAHVRWFNESVNSKTGEFFPAGWHSRKDWLRTGDRVRLLDIMGERTLDKLIFGGGAGMELVAAIREEALWPWKRHCEIYRH